MNAYEIVKTLHIVSAAVLFGTGLGTAFFMWRADRSGEVEIVALAARHTVLADWLFTAPTVVFQPLSGLWLAWQAGIGLSESWLVWTYGLYALAAACWLPVVWLQLRMRDLSAEAARTGTQLPPAYRRYMGLWFRLGWPAFLSVLAIFYLMVAKP
jgi:uncharacterized membrane protein